MLKLLLLLSLSTPFFAQNTDIVSKVIESNQSLKTLSVEVNYLYTKIYNSGTAAQREELKYNEDSWLKDRKKIVCWKDEEEGTTCNEIDNVMVRLLTEFYQLRKKYLQEFKLDFPHYVLGKKWLAKVGNGGFYLYLYVSKIGYKTDGDIDPTNVKFKILKSTATKILVKIDEEFVAPYKVFRVFYNKLYVEDFETQSAAESGFANNVIDERKYEGEENQVYVFVDAPTPTATKTDLLSERIASNPEIAKFDKEVNDLYENLLKSESDKSLLIAEQAKWKKWLEPDDETLATDYLDRIDYLKNDYKNKVNTPSFNCNLAKTAIEKAICSSNKISAQDAEMTLLYKNLLKDALENERKELVDSQREWNKFVKEYCTGEIYSIRRDLTDLYKMRIEYLKTYKLNAPINHFAKIWRGTFSWREITVYILIDSNNASEYFGFSHREKDRHPEKIIRVNANEIVVLDEDRKEKKFVIEKEESGKEILRVVDDINNIRYSRFSSNN